MCDAAGEPADRLELLRLAQLLLELLALADVAADRLGADGLAVLDDQPAGDLDLDRACRPWPPARARRRSPVPVELLRHAPASSALLRDSGAIRSSRRLSSSSSRAVAGRAGRRLRSRRSTRPLEVDGRDQVARVLEQVAVAGLAHAQSLLASNALGHVEGKHDAGLPVRRTWSFAVISTSSSSPSFRRCCQMPVLLSPVAAAFELSARDGGLQRETASPRE